MSSPRSDDDGAAVMTPEYRARFPSAYGSVVAARRALMLYVRQFGLGQAALDDFECAVGEALANAAEHGSSSGMDFEVRAYREGDALVVEVRDNGPGFAHGNPREIAPPPTGAPRGFGIYIMRTLMDEIEYADRGRRVRLKKHLPPAETMDQAADGGSDVSA